MTLAGGEKLDQDSKEAVFSELANKYNWLTSKKEMMSLLIEIEQIILPRLSIEPIHRKSLIRKLRKASTQEVNPKSPRGRRPKYNDFDRFHLVQLWRLSGFPCSKRLKFLLSEWLVHYKCAEAIKDRLKAMSPSQMDLFLNAARGELQRKIASGTIPAKSHIRKLIRLRDPMERYWEPGFLETDTVLHCGHHIWGIYAHTVSITDLGVGWTEGRAIYGKNAVFVVEKLKELKERLPFPMNSLFFDNGIEFVNHHLVQELKEIKGVDVARGRSGRSNDQCHIEQKNNTFVRQIFGHVRIENPDLIPLMNEIYEVWGLLHNYFMPQMKLISKEKIGGKVRKKYDDPKTPYQRIMESKSVPEENKEKLRQIKDKLNPFELQAKLQEKLALFHKLNDEYNEAIRRKPS
jgi:hypothetical protein